MSKIQALFTKMPGKQKLAFQVWLTRNDRLKRIRSRNGFGLNEVIGIVAGLLIAGIVIIPGLMELAGGIINTIENWWTSFSVEIFQSGT